jgi:NitT/TauT family transport system ATP-binding protein
MAHKPELLTLRDVRKVYYTVHGPLEAINNVSLEVQRGSFVSIVGPSGCGKSTLLQIVAGLVEATGGEVTLNGSPVNAPPPEAVYVFQQYSKSVYPWKTVLDNVMFGLKYRATSGTRLANAEGRQRCLNMLETMGLQNFAGYFPYQLSGGMQQRVAIARALVCQPEILLMDEPFSAVDALTRTELQDALLRIWAEFAPTVLFVTHDIDEAIYLSERVIVLSRPPSNVSQSIVIDLPRPRHQLDTRERPGYMDCRRRILADIMGKEPQATGTRVHSSVPIASVG